MEYTIILLSNTVNRDKTMCRIVSNIKKPPITMGGFGVYEQGVIAYSCWRFMFALLGLDVRLRV